MILWTIQSQEAVTVLQRTGLLVADARKTEVSFRPAYRWMTAQMYQRVGKTSRSPTFPIWAWRTWKDSSARPDLRSEGHLPRGARGARIEFVVEPHMVLLSDFLLWHYVLNYWYLPASRKDERAFESTLKKAGLDFSRTKPIPDPVLHSKIQASWARIFDLGLVVKEVTGSRSERPVQATLWALPIDAVREITWFTAR